MKPGEFIELPDERDENNLVVKVSVMFFLPEGTGDGEGVMKRITYNEKNIPVIWAFPPFKNKKIGERKENGETVYVLEDLDSEKESLVKTKKEKSPAKESKKKLK